ncbi:MAG: hypothetical protein C4542_06795 [Dehalococcoidia bacterium]|nr:MAG: hypothetical protein C4542_06795 [Dehalococcoidia bacterium]
MTPGKLFNSLSDELVAGVDYRLFDETPNNWWGELTLTEYKRLADGGYVLELADGRKGRCVLNRKINKAISGLLPLHCFRFRGSTELR